MPRWLIRSPHIDCREDFGKLLVHRMFTGNAVEIGTHLGVFAESFLNGWPGRLTCVDPWQTGMPDYVDPAAHGNRDKHYQQCRERLEKFGDRVSYLRMTSEEAAGHFSDASLDFVYIDGNHHWRYVRQDIQLWWPKVKSGGVFAGHDIGPIEGHEHSKHVRPQVKRHCLQHGLKCYFLLGDAHSWYCFKP